jgi:hypothetical protein
MTLVLVDTIAGSDGGAWMRAQLNEWPGSHVIGYAGDLDKFCALEEEMRKSLIAPKRFGLRCAHLGEFGYEGEVGKAHEETTEHPSVLPKFEGIRVRNLAHMNEVVRAISKMRDDAGGKSPVTFVVWLADRGNMKINMEIKGDEVTPPETLPELPMVH